MQTRAAAKAVVDSRVDLEAIPVDLRDEVFDFFSTWRPCSELTKSNAIRLIFSRPELSRLALCTNETIARAVRCDPALVSRVASDVSTEEAEANEAPKCPGRKPYLYPGQILKLQTWVADMCAAKRYPSLRAVKERIAGELEDTRPDVCPDNTWFHYTVKRVLEGRFKVKNARPFEAERYNVDKEVVEAYFKGLNDPRVKECNPHMFYNVDESGFGASKSGRLKTQKVIVPLDLEGAPACEEPADAHYVTCIACASLDGRLLTPGLVTKRQTDHPDASRCSFFNGARRYTSAKAFVTKRIFADYFVNVIWEDIRSYRLKHPNEPQRAVVIMDGHRSHVTPGMRAFCGIRDIFVLVLPPHTSHLIQMLDRGVFRRAKAEYANFPIDKHFSKISNALERCFEAYEACRVRAFIWRCWRHSGIVPIIENGDVTGYETAEEGIMVDPSLDHELNESAQGRRTEKCEYGFVNEDEILLYEADLCPFCCAALNGEALGE